MDNLISVKRFKDKIIKEEEKKKDLPSTYYLRIPINYIIIN